MIWYRQVSREQWKAFAATFLGWVLDSFDFTILTFVLIDIQNSFSVDKALAGALGTVTLFCRLLGGIAAGTAADRWGRKGPLMISILWFSLFACLSGFSTSYAMLFGFRALFGIGMGGEWAAGMPLALEHWPAHLRGIASGLLQGGYSWGFMLAALTFQFVYPLFRDTPGLGWRAMFWIGVIPALMVLWIRSRVSESPVWLERQRHLQKHRQTDRVSLVAIFHKDMRRVTLQTTVLMGAFMLCYHSLTFWYPTFLRQLNIQSATYLILLNAGAIAGNALWGHLSETSLGRRGAITVASIVTMAAIPAFILSTNLTTLGVGALLMGVGGAGMWGVAPTYLSERYPTAMRGIGPGFAYHVGAAIGSVAPLLIGSAQDRGMSLSSAMATFILIAALFVVTLTWLGPETRGWKFSGVENTTGTPSH